MFDGSLSSCRLLFRVYFGKSGSICAAAPEISSKSSSIDQLEPSSSSSSWSSSLVLWGLIRGGDLFLCFYNWSRFLFACSLGEDMTFSIPLVNNLVLFLLLWVAIWMYLWSLSVQQQKDMPGYCLSLISLLFIRRLFHSPLQIDILALPSSSTLSLSFSLCALQAGYVCSRSIVLGNPRGCKLAQCSLELLCSRKRWGDLAPGFWSSPEFTSLADAALVFVTRGLHLPHCAACEASYSIDLICDPDP